MDVWKIPAKLHTHAVRKKEVKMFKSARRKVWVREYVARLLDCSKGHADYLRRTGKLKSFEPEDVRVFLIDKIKALLGMGGAK